MFEHLDDPRPPQPGPRTLHGVLARSARLRRRRSVLGGVAGVLAFAVAGGAVALLTPRSSAPPPRPEATRLLPSYTVFHRHVTVLPADTPAPPASLADVVFTDDLHGVGLALHDDQTALVRTADGGRTWSIVDGSLPEQVPAQIEFVDATHGFLWGGSAATGGDVPLYVTADGGRSWQRAPIGPVVSDITAIGTPDGADVWAVVGTCRLAASSMGRVCPATVEVSTDGGRTWHATPATPPLAVEMGAAVGNEHVEIARVTTERAFVLGLPTGTGGGDASGVLVSTADGGASWQRLVDPCPTGFETGQEMAATSPTDVWLFCASQASGGEQAKALYRSWDGGFTWALLAVANVASLTDGTVLQAGGRLPTRGYLSPYTVGHENLAVLGQDAWLLADGAPVYATTDGGATWAPVPSLESAGLVGGDGNITFNADGHGWACEAGAGLWETTDTVHWRVIGP